MSCVKTWFLPHCLELLLLCQSSCFIMFLIIAWSLIFIHNHAYIVCMKLYISRQINQLENSNGIIIDRDKERRKCMKVVPVSWVGAAAGPSEITINIPSVLQICFRAFWVFLFHLNATKTFCSLLHANWLICVPSHLHAFQEICPLLVSKVSFSFHLSHFALLCPDVFLLPRFTLSLV